jgi:transcriptional regulator with XRE-family HTH domain
MSDFGRRLREIRIDRKLTQAKIAKHIGVTESQVQFYEKGRNMPPADRLARIVRALCCEMSDLFAAVGSPMPKYRFVRLQKPSETQLIFEFFQRGRGTKADHFRQLEEFDDIDTPLPRLHARNP